VGKPPYDLGRRLLQTDELVNPVHVRGRMDVVRHYALPLPTTIIAQMLGVPSGERHHFHRWSRC
jgi:cytochrome P450